MPNTFANLVLGLWIPLIATLFVFLPPGLAVAVAMLSSQLLAPKRYSFEISGFPELGAPELTAIGAVLGALLFARPRLRNARIGRGSEILFVLFVLGSLMTAATNGDALTYGPLRLPGMVPYDGASLIVQDILRWGVPFFLGRLLVRRPSDLRPILLAFVAFFLLYSLAILWEVRMSPQLHRWVYGYAPSPFRQLVRGTGYRPMVFAGHGLTLSILLSMTCIASVGLYRARVRLFQLPLQPIAAYLFVILLTCKSFAAASYALVACPIIASLRPQIQLRFAAALAAFVFCYPVLRSLDLFPYGSLVGAAQLVSQERASSLSFRFENENVLLDRALDRPWFGWGSWGRHRVYDPVTGSDESVTDGLWIILLGSRGIFGFFCFFGSLLLPVFAAASRIQRYASPSDRYLMAATTWCCVVLAVNLLPNASVTQPGALLAGALTGAIWARPIRAPSRSPARRASTRRGPGPVPTPRTRPGACR